MKFTAFTALFCTLFLNHTVIATNTPLNITQTTTTFYNITYTKSSDGNWYVERNDGSFGTQVFPHRLLLKEALLSDNNPWPLELCTERSHQLEPGAPVGQLSYIGFGWYLLHFETEAEGLHAAQLLNARDTTEAFQFDAAVTYFGTDLWPDQWNLVNTPNNCSTNDQIFPNDINIEQAWAITEGNRNIVVAVIDDGFYMDHEDLDGTFWLNRDEIPNNQIDDDQNGFIDDINGWNFSECVNQTSTLNGQHGTQVAGIIAAKSDNDLGIRGIARGPNVPESTKVMAITAGESGTGQTGVLSAHYQGVYYAVYNDADVINASWGFADPFPLPADIHRIIAATSNTVFVAAAGNELLINNNTATERPIQYPAAFPETIAVTATGCASYYEPLATRIGPEMDIAAPGAVWTTSNSANQGFCHDDPDCYSVFGFTSSATPHVSAIAALMLAANPAIGSQEIVRRILRRTATKTGGYRDGDGNIVTETYDSNGFNPHLGYGLLNGGLAVEASADEAGLASVSVDLPHDIPFIVANDQVRIRWIGVELQNNDRVDIYAVSELGARHLLATNVLATDRNWTWQVTQSLSQNVRYKIQAEMISNSDIRQFSSEWFYFSPIDILHIDPIQVGCRDDATTLQWRSTLAPSQPIELEVHSGLHQTAIAFTNNGSYLLSLQELNQTILGSGSNQFLFSFQIRLRNPQQSQVASEWQTVEFMSNDCNPQPGPTGEMQ